MSWQDRGGERGLPGAGAGPPRAAAPADSGSLSPPDALTRSPGSRGDPKALKGRQRRRRRIAPAPSAPPSARPHPPLLGLLPCQPRPPPSPLPLVPSWEVWTRDEALPLTAPLGAGWHPGGERTRSPHSDDSGEHSYTRLCSHRPGQSFPPGGVTSLLPLAETALALFQHAQI